MSKALIDQCYLFEARLDQELSKHAICLQAERQTGVKKTRLALGLAGSLLALVMMRWIAEATTAVVIFAYPAVMTVSAIEESNKAQDLRWMSYWMIVGFLSMTESVSGGLLQAVVPFYSLLKLAFCVWLFAPQSRGATLVYERALRPLVLTLKNNKSYKEAIATIEKRSESFARSATKAASATVKRVVEESVGRAVDEKVKGGAATAVQDGEEGGAASEKDD